MKTHCSVFYEMGGFPCLFEGEPVINVERADAGRRRRWRVLTGNAASPTSHVVDDDSVYAWVERDAAFAGCYDCTHRPADVRAARAGQPPTGPAEACSHHVARGVRPVRVLGCPFLEIDVPF